MDNIVSLGSRFGALGMSFCLSALLCACGSSGTVAMQPALAGVATVDNGRLLRDGSPWVPYGYYQIAFEVSKTAIQQNPTTTQTFWITASEDYTPTEYSDIKKSGGDSVRIQVSQPGMDPQNTLYSSSFAREVVGAITAARNAGLTVIVSVQDEPQTDDPNGSSPLPNAATQRVWLCLAQNFASDGGVMFELYNEPGVFTAGTDPLFDVPSAQDWQNWQTAMNAVVSTIRSTGAKNVLVADGLTHAEQLTGAPALQDPDNQVVYAAHPYAFFPDDWGTKAWDAEFGEFAKTHPVIISEWGIGYDKCDSVAPQGTAAFLQYLQSLGIGLEAGAWDWSGPYFGSARWDFPSGQFSSFAGSGTTCNTAGFGIGATVNAWYQSGTPPTSPL